MPNSPGATQTPRSRRETRAVDTWTAGLCFAPIPTEKAENGAQGNGIAKRSCKFLHIFLLTSTFQPRKGIFFYRIYILLTLIYIARVRVVWGWLWG